MSRGGMKRMGVGTDGIEEEAFEVAGGDHRARNRITELDGQQKAHPAHVDDRRLMTRRERFEPLAEVGADGTGVGRHVVVHHEAHRSVGRSGRERVAAERAAMVPRLEHVAAFLAQERPYGHAVAEPLGQRHHVGLDAERLIVEQHPQPPHARLDLVEYQQQRVGVAPLAQPREVALGGDVDAALAAFAACPTVTSPPCSACSRLLLISALAIAVLSLLGAAGERIGYDRWLKANTVKRRTHSLFRQGLMLYHHLPNWPEDRVRRLMETFGSMLMEQRVYREVFGVI